MNRTVILDAGHGGVINGVYQTAGKRSPDWELGVLYEGVFNRWIVNEIAKNLEYEKIPYYILVPESEDISLQERVNRVQKIYKTNKNVWLLSIHANAGGGTGIEAYTTVGKTKSDEFADVILKNVEKDLSEMKMRFDTTDGDLDKESNFYILKNVSCPAVLYEAGFMDNTNDYKLLWDRCFHQRLADSLTKSIKKVNEIK
jgi:N-acetylmuramoyl-L-alanine amidase